MVRRPYVLAGVAGVFLLVLVFATLETSPTSEGPDRATLVDLTRECQRAIQESVPDARFPFEANVNDLRGDQVLLSGSVDSGSGLEAERRNYSCYMSVRAELGQFVADSVEVWRSH
jgi:hypothetical protein